MAESAAYAETYRLFNDADEEFPAACSVLSEVSAAAYLDMECLAMLGMQLARRLESGCL